MADAELKRCSRKSRNWQCQKLFSASDWRKYCPDCRLLQKKFHSSTKGKQLHARFAARPERKQYMAKYYHDNREDLSAYKADWNQTPKGRAIQDRANRRIMARLRKSLWMMASGKHPNPVSLVTMGCFKNNEDARQHFSTTFEPWMNWTNHGKLEIGDGYKTKWNIGHRIPISLFDAEDRGDIAKCWDRRNVFAQCAKENLSWSDKLVLSDEQLLELKPIWPSKAMNDLHMLKLMYRNVAKFQAELNSASDSDESEGWF